LVDAIDASAALGRNREFIDDDIDRVVACGYRLQ